jgi:hypothetical protein
MQIIPAFITTAPSEQIELDENSIIIEDESHEYLVGEAASEESLKCHRQVGGSLARPQYQRLLKALVAKTLGEGEHRVTMALSSSKQWLSKFRRDIGSIYFSDENETLLSEIVKDIRFKTKTNISEWKSCRITLEKPTFVFLETQAVFNVIPPQLKSYVLWQIGHGDLQQVVLIDGRAQTETIAQAEGLIGAISKFASNLGISEAQAIKSWHTNILPNSEDMQNVGIDATPYKIKAIKSYYNEVFAALLNKNEKYKEKVKSIILSGGAIKDGIFVDCLKQEIESEGIYKIHKINDLPIKDIRCENPSLTCVYGLMQGARLLTPKGKILALDLGNSYLKSVID